MRRLHLTHLIAIPLALVALVGCAASAPVEPTPATFTDSLNEVRDESTSVVERLTGEFSDATTIALSDANIYACAGEEPDIGRWVWATSFSSTDIAASVTRLQDQFGDAVTSTGTSAQDIEYADGTPYEVSQAHTLIEDETGSYLFTYPAGAQGVVGLRVISRCGVLR